MYHLLVDGFEFKRREAPARFGRPVSEVIRRVGLEVRQVTARLDSRGVVYEVVAHRDVESIHILPDGDTDLNRLAHSWREDFEGLGLVICPLLFAIHGGAYGAFSPVSGLFPSEDDVSPDMRWLADRLPEHAILLRPDATAGVAPEAFVIRHELDHARRSLAAMHGSVSVERTAFTLHGHEALPLFFGGKLETEEIFVHAADVETARQSLLGDGIYAYPGMAASAKLAGGLRDAHPTPRMLVAQIAMTARIGCSVADSTLDLLPQAQAALAAGARPVCKRYRAVTWGTLEFVSPSAESAVRAHVPIELGADARADLRSEAFSTNLGQLDDTVRDHRLLLEWVAETLFRFEQDEIPASRFAGFLRTLDPPRKPGASGYRRLDAGHFERLFEGCA